MNARARAIIPRNSASFQAPFRFADGAELNTRNALSPFRYYLGQTAGSR